MPSSRTMQLQGPLPNFPVSHGSGKVLHQACSSASGGWLVQSMRTRGLGHQPEHSMVFVHLHTHVALEQVPGATQCKSLKLLHTSLLIKMGPRGLWATTSEYSHP